MIQHSFPFSPGRNGRKNTADKQLPSWLPLRTPHIRKLLHHGARKQGRTASPTGAAPLFTYTAITSRTDIIQLSFPVRLSRPCENCSTEATYCQPVYCARGLTRIIHRRTETGRFIAGLSRLRGSGPKAPVRPMMLRKEISYSNGFTF